MQEVAYTEEPEGSKWLVFKGYGAQDSDDSLAGTSWALESLGELDGREITSPWDSVRLQVVDMDVPISGTQLTIEFDDSGELRGDAGCNDYFSNNYSTTSGIFVAGAVGSTGRMCGEPAGIMEQESRFLELSGAAEFYTVSGDTLTMTVPGRAKDYVIRPSNEENELVVIRARISNNAATRVELDIEALPPELRMDSGRYHSVNTYEARTPTEGVHAEMNEYVPLIRGYHYLEKGLELEGWLIFDVPKGSLAESFKWVAGEEIIIDITYLSAPTPTPTTTGIGGGRGFGARLSEGNEEEAHE